MSWSSDPARDYDRWVDRQERGFREAVEAGRLYFCAGCRDYHNAISGPEPKDLDGEQYCLKSFFAELRRRAKEKKVA